MMSLISYFFMLTLKYFAKLFYRFEVNWPKGENRMRWNDVRLLVFLNHTSLYEFLYLGILPNSFLRRMSKKMVVPAADKTLDRPVVGIFFKLFSPGGMVKITRKRDESWEKFLGAIAPDSMILIAPEGRMMRKNGLDLEGNKMTVRGGILDVLEGLDHGQMAIAYSGGLHHVQIPGEGWPRVFKTLKLNIETFEIEKYKAMFQDTIGSEAWRRAVLDDMQKRLETKVPKF